MICRKELKVKARLGVQTIKQTLEELGGISRVSCHLWTHVTWLDFGRSSSGNADLKSYVYRHCPVVERVCPCGIIELRTLDTSLLV